MVLYLMVSLRVHASVPQVMVSHVQGITDSARVKVLAHLARGELAQAVEAYETATGLKAPLWLAGFKAAFDTSKQVAGACQGVAQTIHRGFTAMGGRPEYVKLSTVADETGRHAGYISFTTDQGKHLMLTDIGNHFVVRMRDRVYDAYTGPAGLPWHEYMSRLSARTPIVDEVVSAP